MELKNFDEINKAVMAAGEVLTLEMWQLRDANKSGRLGPYVVEAISKELAKRGIGHYPPDLPQNQWDKVRIFKLGSQVADLISLVSSPGEENDEKLREFAANSAAEKLDQIRQIVC